MSSPLFPQTTPPKSASDSARDENSLSTTEAASSTETASTETASAATPRDDFASSEKVSSENFSLAIASDEAVQSEAVPRESVQNEAVISRATPAVSADNVSTKKRRVSTPVLVAGLCAASALGAAVWHSQQLPVVVNTTSTRSAANTTATPKTTPKNAPQSGAYSLPDFITGTPKLSPQKPTNDTSFSLPNASTAKTSPLIPNANNESSPNTQLPGQLSNAPSANANSANANSANTNSANANSVNSPVAALFQKAVAAQRAKRLDEAITLYRQLLQIKPDTVEARVNLALLLLETKRPDAALSQLRLARKTDRKNAAVAFQIAQILLEQKRPREAVDPLQSVVAIAPKNPQGWATLAQTQAVLNRRDEAIAAWKRVALLLPNDARAPLAIASLAGEQNRLGEAEKWARTAVRISRKNAPRDPRAAFVLGRVLASRQKLREAENVLRDGLKQFPDALELGTTLSDVRWSRGDKSGAIATLQSLLARVPAARDGGVPRAQLLSQIARAQSANKQPKAAAQTWQTASETLPDNAELRSLWGESLLQSGDKKGGISQLRRALALDPKRAELRWPLARALAASGDWKNADIEYSKMRRANAKANRNPDLLSEHAQVQERAKQPQDALSTWRKIADVMPRSPLPLLQQGRLLRAQKRDGEALRVLNRALDLKPNEPNALLGAAQIENNKNPKRALKLWTSLAQTRPDFALAYGRAMSLAVAQRQTVATANALRAPLRRQTENRAAFGAVLRGLVDANETDVAQKYIKTFRDDFPKANAPLWAEAALNVEMKKREIAAAETRSSSSGSKTPPDSTTSNPTTSTRTAPTLSRPKTGDDSGAPRSRWTPKPLATPAANDNSPTTTG